MTLHGDASELDSFQRWLSEAEGGLCRVGMSLEVCEGRIETRELQVSTSAERPQLTCANVRPAGRTGRTGRAGQAKLLDDLPTLAGLGKRSIPKDETYESPGTCSIEPPKTGSVEVYFDGEADPDMPWQLQEVNGDPDPLQVKRNENCSSRPTGPPWSSGW